MAEVVLHINDDDGGAREIKRDELAFRLHRDRPWRRRLPHQIGSRLRD